MGYRTLVKHDDGTIIVFDRHEHTRVVKHVDEALLPK